MQGTGFDANLLRSLHAAVAGEDHAVAIYEYRVCETELSDKIRNLPDLLTGMRSGLRLLRFSSLSR